MHSYEYPIDPWMDSWLARTAEIVDAWLGVNGEAIYGITPYKVFGEGPTKVGNGGFNAAERAPYSAQDIRFTTKGDVLYAITLARPAGSVRITSLGHSARHAGRDRVRCACSGLPMT